jgi:hypothetical protein
VDYFSRFVVCDALEVSIVFSINHTLVKNKLSELVRVAWNSFVFDIRPLRASVKSLCGYPVAQRQCFAHVRSDGTRSVAAVRT